jgi:hypothetical protein
VATVPVSPNRILYGWNLLLTTFQNRLHLTYKKTVISAAVAVAKEDAAEFSGIEVV